MLCAAILLVVVMISGRAAANTAQQKDGRIVTIHDGDVEKVVITKGKTIADALKKANVTVETIDSVEPATNTELVAKNYQVNIYRARPVTIVDGESRIKVMTAHQSARQIATQAKMQLYDEDTTEMARVDDVISEGGAGLKLTVDRATPFKIKLYGKKITMRTQATTVGEMFTEKGIKLAKNDDTSVKLNRKITANMSIEVWRNGKQTMTQDEAIAFETEQVQDADREIGYKAVKTPGVKGEKAVTYEIIMKNGKEVSRKVIQSVVTKKPKKQVEVIGSKFISGDISADKESFMQKAGIAASDFGYVDHIVSRESGWCATKWQGEIGGCPAYHGAPGEGVGYGLCQSTPASKMATAGADWATNPVTQLRWCSSYAVGKYGSWSAAYAFWTSNHWW